MLLKVDNLSVVYVTKIVLLFISLAQGNHWQSLRYFLELGIITTDFFTDPVTKNIYNDQVRAQGRQLCLPVRMLLAGIVFGAICVSVCLCVCLSAQNLKNY